MTPPDVIHGVGMSAILLPIGGSDPWPDFTEVEWRAICDATEIYQDTTGGEIISGEPWEDARGSHA